MADEEGFYFEVEFLSFLQKWIKTEILFENFDSEAAQGHAEVFDQSIGLLHPVSHCYDHGKFDKFKFGLITVTLFPVTSVHLLATSFHQLVTSFQRKATLFQR